jgi:hypothetical protein
MRDVLRKLVAAVMIVHGLIHLMGAAKGFRWATVSQLSEPVGVLAGVGWLLASLLVLAAASALAMRVRGWWVVTAVAAVASQMVILTSWNDAGAGTAANILLLIAAGYGCVSQGPRSFRAEYRRRCAAALAAVPSPTGAVTDADLAHLPPAVAAYLRRSGAVGRPRVGSFHAVIHGRIRSGPSTRWMAFTGEQLNTVGPHPHRLFLMDATLLGLPVDVLHVFDDRSATMRVRACSVLPMADAAGAEADRAETVTLFNDLCVLAPAALVDAPVTWQTLDDHRVRGSYTIGGQTVTAELVFNDDDDLVDFVSDDRLRAAPDGKTFVRQGWSTPIRTRTFLGERQVGVMGEARWHAPQPEGVFTYLEFHADDITYNPAILPPAPSADAGQHTPAPEPRSLPSVTRATHTERSGQG